MKLSLGARIFLATALLVTFAVAAAVAVTYLLGTRIADRAARDTLARSGWVQRTFEDTLIEQVRSSAYQLAGDPHFSAYVSEAIELGDAASLRDQLGERLPDLGVDLLMILDAEGFAVAQAAGTPILGEDLSRDPLFEKALEEFDAAGVWTRDRRLFYAAAVPVGAGDVLAGFLIAAVAIDGARAEELGRINGTEVTFLLTRDGPPAWVASSLDPALADTLTAAAAARPELLGPSARAVGGDRHLEIELRRRSWLGLVRPLEDITGRTVGAAISLASLAEQLEPYLRISRIFAAVGLVAILLALATSYLLPRRVLQPISRLSRAAAAAAEGDYDQEIRAESSDEVGRLASAFSTLLAELREKRDMEIYVSELTRNLPDPEATTREAVPAEEREVMLLGVELRDYGRASGAAPGAPHRALETFTRDLRRLSRAVRTQSGKIEAILGHRLVASFEGTRRADRALQAAAAVLARDGGGYDAAMAMASGAAVTGTITWDSRPDYALTGPLVDELENLLRVARTGSLLLSQTARRELGRTLEQASVVPREHRSTVSEAPLFSLTADDVRRFSGLALTATLEMTPSDATPSAAATLSGIGVGSVLDDRFEILSELGAGGMGVVYKARDRTLNELVALKMLKQDVWGDGDRLEGLKDELRLARKISHPNVLRTFDFGDAGGFPFISMEYVRGITLKHLLEQSGRLPLSAGLRLARQLCRGLAAAHGQGVLHRDIKPENLIIEPNGNAKLMDFGIAKPLRRRGPMQTEPGMLVGTPFYVAPEQLEGAEADERSDVYACGVVFYEIFTGALPYPIDGGLGDVIRRKLNDPPTPPREHWPGIPPTLERTILRCMARDREARFRDVASLLAELETLRA